MVIGGKAVQRSDSKELVPGPPFSDSPPSVDRTWDIWGSYYNIPKATAIFYVLQGSIYLKGTIAFN